MGYISVIEAAGGKVFSDACPVWLLKRLKEGQPRVIATDSAKLASTVDMHRAEGKNFGFFYGSAQECVEAGIREHRAQRV
jgi:predicted aconitase